MANFLYPWARNAFLSGHAGWTPNWGSDTVNVMFINAGVGTNYTFSGTGATGYAWQPSLSETNAQAGYANAVATRQDPTCCRAKTRTSLDGLLHAR